MQAATLRRPSDSKPAVAALPARLAQLRTRSPQICPNRRLSPHGSVKKEVLARNVEAGARDWVGPGYLSTFYDPYNVRAREIYWRQIRDRLASLGIDAWWLDASEPDMHSNLSIEERARRMGPTALGPGAAYFNSYPLMHAGNLHDHLVQYRPDVRPMFAGRPALELVDRLLPEPA